MGFLLVALIFAPLAAARANPPAYIVTDLTSTGSSAFGYGVDGSTQVGFALDPTHYFIRALLWRGTAASVVDLTPANFNDTYAVGVFGSTQVGHGYPSDAVDTHALLWRGTAASAVDLHPAGFVGSDAYATSADTQVGDAYTLGDSDLITHAFLWHGTAGSAVDLNPAGYAKSSATGISGNVQVGYGQMVVGVSKHPLNHALLWRGAADSVVDLNPPGFTQSFAEGVSGGAQVGDGSGPATGVNIYGTHNIHALLWAGTADSAVDLHPAGYSESVAFAVSGSTQVGYGYARSDGYSHALLWHGTAKSVVDLSKFLPDGYNQKSSAQSVDRNGDIIGSGYGDKGYHAFLWHLNTSAPLGITTIAPDPVDMGHSAFTLQVSGTKFTPATVVRYNGQALATAFVTSQFLQAQVPTALVANSGTADITVQTPRVATSGALTFHIRPLLTGLSPSSVNAGASAFTLMVNGAGYTADSIVVFDGVNLVTHYVSPTQLTAAVPAALLSAHGRTSVMVTIPHVATSRGTGFDVTP